MKYETQVTLKDGSPCCIRSATIVDAQTVYDLFLLTHEQTDFLSSYADETSFDVAYEAGFIEEFANSERDVLLCAVVDDTIAGTAMVKAVGKSCKVRHRAEFGISIDEAFWGRGIGRVLLNACIDCAKSAGFAQLELGVVSENVTAVALYESAGFREFGRNPKGLCSRSTGWQEEILMRLELD